VTALLSRSPLPGLFITGTDTGVGKTLVAGAIASWFHQRGARVAVLKPAATGCVRRREGLVSEDAEFLAHCADARHPLDLICPQRYAEPLAPAVAADRAGQPLDWTAIQRSIDLMSRDSDVLIVEGVGGVMVPMDERHTVLDMIHWLALQTVVVARPGLGTINHTLMTLAALRGGPKVAGIVINRYPAENPGVAEETNLRVLEKWGRVPLLSVIPDEPVPKTNIPANIAGVLAGVDWAAVAGFG